METMEEWHYRHLKTNTLINRDDILDVSENIDNSFSGRIDIWGLHIFFVEAACMIRNAVYQYEKGFTDAAFYSVRSALELARVVTYFSSQSCPLKSDTYRSWAQGEKFPFDSKVKALLINAGSAYSEIREVLSDFFEMQDDRLKRANKYIHKQGYKTFYTQSTIQPDLEKARRHAANELFTDFITNSVIEIALLRLCVDPFPVLLQDESVMHKIHFQSVTFPFAEKTINFIGTDKIEKYRSTMFYKSHTEMYASNEDLCEEAYELMNDEYYNRNSWQKIKPQLNLLSINDQLAVLIFNLSKAISDIYFYGGFAHYFSDVHSANGTIRGFDSRDLRRVKESKAKCNVQYQKAYMSYFSYNDTECWIEHNYKFTEQQIQGVHKIIDDTITKNIEFFQK